MIENTQFRRRNLPHWDIPGATYFVTSCLQGSIPARGLLELAKYRKELEARKRPDEMTEEEWDVHCWKLRFVCLETYLDERPGVRWLERADLATFVRDSLLHFAGQRYDLYAYVVMPSQFHWLFRPLPTWVATLPDTRPRRSPRERVMYSARRYSARQCNTVLGLRGEFWQHESYDHWIRDNDELERIIRYIENNPVKARLASSPGEWPYSSASHRAKLRLPFGYPLPKLRG